MTTAPSNILLTIDVEDWFQVENFKPCIPFSTWSSRDLRVERNTHRLLDLFDSTTLNPRATFFILGWIAERLPSLIREIHARGHEVASHGCNHELLSSLDAQALIKDLNKSKSLLEDIIGSRVYGYRAPSFSIDKEILGYIRDAGYLYDSSYNSFALHGRYGRLPLSPNGNRSRAPALAQPVKGLYELPISNMHLGGRVIPWGGGAYFRLIPERVFRSGMRFILKGQNAYVMYMHPWEIDPDQPRVKEASFTRRFRHYSNLGKTSTRLQHLISAFSNCNFTSCKDYITENRHAGG
ncbi:MAG: XrtA system polysaccharide deacetylase [Desulfobacteraceae bacterium]